ncbi:MAG: hypothetical protein ACRD99_01975 [Nitrososphaera sp.]
MEKGPAAGGVGRGLHEVLFGLGGDIDGAEATSGRLEALRPLLHLSDRLCRGADRARPLLSSATGQETAEGEDQSKPDSSEFPYRYHGLFSSAWVFLMIVSPHDSEPVGIYR